jgi:hypothetical protein
VIGTDDGGDPPRVVAGARELRVGDRLARGCDRELGEAAVALDVARLEHRQRIETLDVSDEPNGPAAFRLGNRAHAALAGDQRRVRARSVETDRAERADAGDHHRARALRAL